MYLKDIKNLPRISEKKEVELSNIILNSDNEEEVDNAVKEMVEGNVMLAVKYAFNYHRRYSNSLSKMDLIAEANAGLVKAARKYDATTGNRFSTYAVRSICSHMDRAIQNSRFVRIPLSHFKYLSELRKLLEKHGENISDEELIMELGVTVSMLNSLKNDLDNKTILTLNNESSALDVTMDISTDDPSKNIQLGELRGELKECIETLSPMEKEIVMYKHFSETDMTYEEIASKYGVTRQRIGQIHNKALKKLKRHLKKINKRKG